MEGFTRVGISFGTSGASHGLLRGQAGTLGGRYAGSDKLSQPWFVPSCKGYIKSM